MNFSDLGLSDEVLKAVADAGYTQPTPIQEKAIPVVLMGRDVLGCAQTGTGKTAGFTLPMIDILAGGRARARMPRSLILEPTRELAAQVAESFEKYGKYNKLNMALLIGGTSMGDQETVLSRGVDVLIATPGRLIDVFERGHLLLRDVKILVIDEADRMLDMGFIPDIERIVGRLPVLRQTLFFSATMPPEIRRLADRFLSNPKAISVDPPSTTATTVTQALVKTAMDPKAKRAALRQLLKTEEIQSALIFCNRKRDVAVLHRSLERHGFDAKALHGDMVQAARTETLDVFKKGQTKILVCSDVAARGLDIPAVSHVFNYDVPIHGEDYVHRIGRTGRRPLRQGLHAGDPGRQQVPGVDPPHHQERDSLHPARGRRGPGRRRERQRPSGHPRGARRTWPQPSWQRSTRERPPQPQPCGAARGVAGAAGGSGGGPRSRARDAAGRGGTGGDRAKRSRPARECRGRRLAGQAGARHAARPWTAFRQSRQGGPWVRRSGVRQPWARQSGPRHPQPGAPQGRPARAGAGPRQRPRQRSGQRSARP